MIFFMPQRWPFIVLIFIKKCEFWVNDEGFGILIYTGDDAEPQIGVRYM